MAGFLGSAEEERRELILESTIREWAKSDCVTYPCGLSVWSYVCEIAGIPEPLLPPHQTREAMRTLLRDHGGLEQYARSLVEPLGWREIATPGRGDVGVAMLPEMGLTCAIHLGTRWMAKGKRFVLTLPAPHVAAWRLEQCLKP